MNSQFVGNPNEGFIEEPLEEIPAKYIEIEQSEKELDPWADSLLFAQNTVGELQRLTVKDPDQQHLPQFVGTIFDVAHQAVQDSAANYFIGSERNFDPTLASHRELNLNGLYKDEFLSRRVSRLWTYYPTTENVKPRSSMVRITREGYRSATFTMEHCGTIEIFDDGIADKGHSPMRYGVTLNLSNPENSKLGGVKIFAPFSSVDISWTKQPDFTWERRTSLHLSPLFTDLGYPYILREFPVLRSEELELLQGVLAQWKEVGKSISPEKYAELTKQNLEIPFRSRVMRLIRKFSDHAVKGLDPKDPTFDPKAIEILNAWADKSSYVQGRLFPK